MNRTDLLFAGPRPRACSKSSLSEGSLGVVSVVAVGPVDVDDDGSNCAERSVNCEFSRSY